MFGNDIATSLCLMLFVVLLICIDFRLHGACAPCIYSLDACFDLFAFCFFIPFSLSFFFSCVSVRSHCSIRQFETSVVERRERVAGAGACSVTVFNEFMLIGNQTERKLNRDIYYVIRFCVVFAIYSMQSI